MLCASVCVLSGMFDVAEIMGVINDTDGDGACYTVLILLSILLC